MARLLIVDDEENNRLVLRDALENEGFIISEAENGEEALRSVDQARPDLILLDVQMPVLDGHETLRKLKQQEETSAIPVIMVTALDMDSQVSMFLNDGAIDHISKPYSTMVVRARVKAALREKAAPSEDHQHANRGKLIAFIGAKGGVGTTTVALNCAATLAAKEKKVTAVEHHPWVGSFANDLGMWPTENLADLLEDESSNITCSKTSNILVKHQAGFEVLLGPQKGQEYLEDRPEATEQLIESLIGRAEFTIFDLPTHPTKGVQTVLRRCDLVVVVLEREPSSVKAAGILLDMMKSHGVGGGTVSAVVVTRSVHSSPITSEYLQKNLDCRLVAMIPPDPDACIAAVRSGTPVVNARPDSLCSLALMEMSERFADDQVPALTF